jgi:aldose 1-epimerase
MIQAMWFLLAKAALLSTSEMLWIGATLLLSTIPVEASTSQSEYGRMPDGTAVDIYTLTNSNGCVCKVITFGAAISELDVPDRTGKMGDVVLGFDKLAEYVKYRWCFGAVCGRVANRIANGRFTIGGKTYALSINEKPNSLQGGVVGFDRIVWNAKALDSTAGPSVVLHHVSPDGEEGYPGTLTVRVTYTLTNRNELQIDYEATTDKDTPVNLMNHSFFNLACKGDVLGHVLQLKAKRYVPTRSDLIPTGEIADVAGGPLDFTKAKAVGKDIKMLPRERNGYDNCFVIDGGGGDVVLAARVYEPVSGRSMEVWTDQPAVQLYTSNSFDGTLVGKRGWAFPVHAGICLETQHYPDSVNEPSFPTTILRPGEIFHSTTIYRFSTM